MAPAQQRFAAANATARERDPGLEEQLELLVFERLRKVALDATPLQRGLFDIGVKKAGSSRFLVGEGRGNMSK